MLVEEFCSFLMKFFFLCLLIFTSKTAFIKVVAFNLIRYISFPLCCILALCVDSKSWNLDLFYERIYLN